MTTALAPEAVGAVVAWGVPRLRDLPWRRTRDPWAVLVSEVMLQQTSVGRVQPKWIHFLDVFPTPTACAAAPLGDVLRVWQGLGYPRRARNLHGAATAIVARHGGCVPSTLDELRALPGVGQYTARAVLCFAYEHDAAVVDVNIGRVLSRAAGRRLSAAEAQKAADDSLVVGTSWAWNQALMDLGAVVCTARAPACAQCPIHRWCAWDRDLAADPGAAVHKQGRFEGSDRQARGRLMRAAGTSPIRASAIAMAAGLVEEPARAAALAAALITEGLLVHDGDTLRLP